MSAAPFELHVVRAGALTTVQDAGRPGLAHLGVPRSGAMDPGAHRRANRLLGNPETLPVLESTLDGVTVQPAHDAVLAVCGALADVSVEGRPAPWSAAVRVRAGEHLDVGPALRGVRCYVAVAGGIEVEPVLGSASCDLLSGLGPAPLADGDVLGCGHPPSPVPGLDMAPFPLPEETVEIRVDDGPRGDWLSSSGARTLRDGEWTVSPDSNRIALRLRGPGVERARDGELESEGLVLGAVQCLPDGGLVLFGPDHPTTGGYPVVAVVHPDSLGACAQARPGTRVRLRRVG